MNSTVLAFLLITTFFCVYFDSVSCLSVKKIADDDVENFTVPFPKDFDVKKHYMHWLNMGDEDQNQTSSNNTETVQYEIEKIFADDDGYNYTVPFLKDFHVKKNYMHWLNMGDEDQNQTSSNNTETFQYENEKIIKLKVTLYMEALCPGCHSFIKNQLYPVFMKIPQYIKLDLIPYGNAKHYTDSTGKINFTCQHGEPECIGNMYLACVTHNLQAKRPKHMLRYYKCIADALSFSIEKDVKDCAKVAYVNFHRLDTCVKTEGPKILAHYGDRTHALVGRQFVPTVVVDDNFVIKDQDEMDLDLFRYLCKRFKGRKPKECAAKLAGKLELEDNNIEPVLRSDVNSPQIDYYRPDFPDVK